MHPSVFLRWLVIDHRSMICFQERQTATLGEISFRLTIQKYCGAMKYMAARIKNNNATWTIKFTKKNLVLTWFIIAWTSNVITFLCGVGGGGGAGVGIGGCRCMNCFSILEFDTIQVLYWPVLGLIQFCSFDRRCTTCLDTKLVLIPLQNWLCASSKTSFVPSLYLLHQNWLCAYAKPTAPKPALCLLQNRLCAYAKPAAPKPALHLC